MHPKEALEPIQSIVCKDYARLATLVHEVCCIFGYWTCIFAPSDGNLMKKIEHLMEFFLGGVSTTEGRRHCFSEIKLFRVLTSCLERPNRRINVDPMML